MSTCNLTDKKCIPCEGGTNPLTPAEVAQLLANLKDWTVSADNKFISKKFTFKNFLRTVSFVNAIAYLAEKEGHHPDIKFGYNYCEVIFTTHALDGLSENDFICAAKIDLL